MSDHPIITPDQRWTVERASSSGHGGWVQVSCWRFTDATGKVSWADYLSPEQSAEYERQQTEGKAAADIRLLEVLMEIAA